MHRQVVALNRLLRNWTTHQTADQADLGKRMHHHFVGSCMDMSIGKVLLKTGMLVPAHCLIVKLRQYTVIVE